MVTSITLQIFSFKSLILLSRLSQDIIAFDFISYQFDFLWSRGDVWRSSCGRVLDEGSRVCLRLSAGRYVGRIMSACLR